MKDESVVASFVRDAVNCGLDGVNSATDALRFKFHKGFWDEVARKLNKNLMSKKQEKRSREESQGKQEIYSKTEVIII